MGNKRLEGIESEFRFHGGMFNISSDDVRWLISEVRRLNTLPEDADARDILRLAEEALDGNSKYGSAKDDEQKIRRALSLLAPALARVKELQGAVEAADQRLIDAASKAGVTYMGCDTPDHLAERVKELEAGKAAPKGDVAKLLSECRMSIAVNDPYRVDLRKRLDVALASLAQERGLAEAINDAMHADDLSDFQKLVAIGCYLNSTLPLTDYEIKCGREIAKARAIVEKGEK